MQHGRVGRWYASTIEKVEPAREVVRRVAKDAGGYAKFLGDVVLLTLEKSNRTVEAAAYGSIAPACITKVPFSQENRVIAALSKAIRKC